MKFYTRMRNFSVFFLVGVFALGVVFISPVSAAKSASDISCSDADVNGDRKVNIIDLVSIARLFGQRTGNPESGLIKEDINQDGAINIIDLVLVARQFGANCSGFIVGDFDGDACVNVQDLVSIASQQSKNPIDQSEFYGKLFQFALHFGDGCNPLPEKLPYSAEADVNGDFVINKGDFDIVTGQFGQSGSGLQGDVDKNGSVNVSDLILIAQRLGVSLPVSERQPVCPSNKRGKVCVVSLAFQNPSVTEAVVGQSVGLTATVVNEANDSVTFTDAYLQSSKSGVYFGLEGGGIQTRPLSEGIVLAPKSGRYVYNFDVRFTEAGTYHFIMSFLKKDGVVTDAPTGVMTIKVVPSSAWNTDSQRVVFVPIQKEPARAQGFASVLKSIFWVIGD
ncbi:MAG: dockerin type I domain-containing protein [bacterium]|nr:dockerin type I domain-containing protein [bacterium]